MNKKKKYLLWFGFGLGLLIIYIWACSTIYFNQEKYLFQHYKMNRDSVLNYQVPHEELYFQTENNVSIHGVIFKQPHSKGLVIINRGSGGFLKNYNPKECLLYSKYQYNVFIYDYRGNGKSQGISTGKESLFIDLRVIYQHFAAIYGEKSMVLLGNSFGTGIAAKIASENHPQLVILKSAYYTYNDVLMKKSFWAPLKLIIRYQFETWNYIQNFDGDMLIFHGTEDSTIPLEKTKKLLPYLKHNQKFIVIDDAGHNNLDNYPEYFQEIDAYFNHKKMSNQ